MEKIRNAIEYVMEHGVTKESVNDACNIYADSYEEYMTLWEYLVDAFNDYDLT